MPPPDRIRLSPPTAMMAPTPAAAPAPRTRTVEAIATPVGARAPHAAAPGTADPADLLGLRALRVSEAVIERRHGRDLPCAECHCPRQERAGDGKRTFVALSISYPRLLAP